MEEKHSELVSAIIVACLILVILSVFMLLLFFTFLNKRKRMFKEKILMQQQFQYELIQTQFEVQEQTRKTLAADLHDNIGQLLSLTNVTLASISINDKEKAEQKISDTQDLVTRSIRELRQLSKIIHGEQLIQQGLRKTIEQEITWLERNGHYSVELIYALPDFEINTADKDLFAYRLLQESINNIIKHSGANRVKIEISFIQSSLQMSITDNGIGFNMDEKFQKKMGIGLLNMQKRIDMLKGSMRVDSHENEGTTITFSIPYP